MADTYYKLIATKLTPHFREAADLVEEKVPQPGPKPLASQLALATSVFVPMIRASLPSTA